MAKQVLNPDQVTRTIIHTPAEAAQSTQDVIRKIQNDPGGGVPWGLPEVDAVVHAARPGELITIIGAPSNLKSFLMNCFAYEEARRIVARGDPSELVIKITWEQSVEEDTLSWIAKESQIPTHTMVRGEMDANQWKIMEKSGIDRTLTPIWIVGHSLNHAIASRTIQPRLTMTDATNALDMIVNKMTGNRLKPRLIIFDYLQRIRPDKSDGDTRREQVSEIIHRIKDVVVSLGCPGLLGVQKLRDKNATGEENIPTIYDGMETAAIEQDSDTMYGVWYPIKTEKIGSFLYGMTVDPTLAVVRNLKQKLGGSAPHTFVLKIDPSRNQILGAKKVA